MEEVAGLKVADVVISVNPAIILCEIVQNVETKRIPILVSFIPSNSTKGEPKEREVDGMKQIWCGKFCDGKGIWAIGNTANHTHEHHGSNRTDDTTNESNLSQNQSINDSSKPSEQESETRANIGYVDEPLAFGFFGALNNDPGTSKRMEKDKYDINMLQENDDALFDRDHPKEFWGKL